MSRKGRKEKRRQERPGERAGVAPLLSRRGKRWLAAGFLLTAAGYGVLSLSDSRGQNGASRLSPFILLAGYAAMGVGLWIGDVGE